MICASVLQDPVAHADSIHAGVARQSLIMPKGAIMSASESKNGDSPALGIGGDTSGEAGSTRTHETMAETGGSGGEALTKPHKEESAGSGSSGKIQGDALQHAVDVASAPEGAGTAATASARGAQDTRSQQAGIQETGLGTPETGGNQSEADLAPPRKP
jgi:hypothetical protein